MKRVSLVAALLVAGACQKPADTTAAAEKPKAPAPPVKVETGEVKNLKMPHYFTLTGTILASQESRVAANVNGRIAATYVERGQAVKKGQVLASVDSKAAGLSATAAAAQSRAAETQVQLAQTECERADKLFAQGAMAKAEYDRVKTQCTAQIYSANAARANAELAEKLAGDTVIRAPFDGVVGERFVNVGEFVQAPSPIVTLYAVDPVKVQISVPEAGVGLVKEAQTLDVRVSSYPGKAFPAVVRYVSPALRPQTRDLVVDALARNESGELRPGMFATVQLLVGEDETPAVPVDAVKVDGTVKRLFYVRDGHAVEEVVRTGVEKDGWVALLEKVPAGEKVVVKPPPNLRDGSAIQ